MDVLWTSQPPELWVKICLLRSDVNLAPLLQPQKQIERAVQLAIAVWITWNSYLDLSSYSQVTVEHLPGKAPREISPGVPQGSTLYALPHESEIYPTVLSWYLMKTSWYLMKILLHPTIDTIQSPGLLFLTVSQCSLYFNALDSVAFVLAPLPGTHYVKSGDKFVKSIKTMPILCLSSAFFPFLFLTSQSTV